RDLARSWNPVDDFVVHADAHRARESIDDRRSGPRTLLLQELRADGVELRGGNSRPHLPRHFPQRPRHDSADGPQSFEFLIGLDGHFFSLRDATQSTAGWPSLPHSVHHNYDRRWPVVQLAGRHTVNVDGGGSNPPGPARSLIPRPSRGTAAEWQPRSRHGGTVKIFLRLCSG